MTIVLYRVDERLIHGQVVVGWGSRLDPTRYVVVDDEVAASPWEQDLYMLGLPESVAALFVTIREGCERLEEWRTDASRTVLLTRDVETMLEVAKAAKSSELDVNLGGLHHAEGRQEVLPYLHLSDGERESLRELAASGARVTAQDLPGSRRTPLDELT